MAALTAALFVTTFLLVSHMSGTVHAYLDPATGSMAIQLILGAFVAAIATARLYWDRLRTLVRKRSATPEAAANRR
jgi:hypothetical protein